MTDDGSIAVFAVWVGYTTIPFVISEIVLFICAFIFTMGFIWMLVPLGIYLSVPFLLYITNKLGIMDGS